WLAVWTQYHYNGPCDQLVAARVTASGTVLDPQGIPVTCVRGDTRTAVVFDGTNFVVLWPENNLGHDNLYNARIATSGALLTPIPEVTAMDVTSYFKIGAGCDGASYCLFVYETSSGLRGVRWPKGGTKPIDPIPITISTTASDRTPRVAFDGNNFV